jgi:hypothetical protein
MVLLVQTLGEDPQILKGARPSRLILETPPGLIHDKESTPSASLLLLMHGVVVVVVVVVEGLLSHL